MPTANAQQTSGIEAGAASADITGRVGTPMFAYTARSYIFSPDAGKTQARAMQMLADPDTGLYAKTFEPSIGIHTRLLARAIVLREGGVKYALAQADLGGLPYALVQEVASRIRGTGIDAQHILLSATHSHSSVGDIWPADNNGYAFVGGDAFDPRVFDSTAQGIADAIIAANAHMHRVQIGFGVGAAPDASQNRSFEAFQHDLEVVHDSVATQRAESVDPTVVVMRVDLLDGKPLALWSNFAVHPTSFGDGNLLFSGDNAGIAARLAESAIARAGGLKGGHVVDVWTNGAQGDVAPNGDSAQINGQAVDWIPDGAQAASADLAGERDAAGIVAAWRDAGQHMSRSLSVGSRSFFFSFDGTSYGGLGGQQEPVGPVPILGQGGVVQKDGTCSPVDVPGQGTKMPLLGGPGLAPADVPVSFWRIGRVGFAAFPVEITKQMGVRIRAALLKAAGGQLDRIVIVGLTNGYWSYTATPEEYDYCGYEGSFTLFGREEGYGWLAAGNELESALLSGKPAPTGFPEPPEAAFGTTATTPIRPDATAGTVVKDVAPSVSRYGYATFSWQGGDPQVDAPRGTPFVSLQILGGDNAWHTVATDDTFEDTTQRSAGDVWTETFQFDRCRALGTYRFHVTGQAVRSAGGPVEPYVVDSKPFAVGPVKIDPGAVTVTNGVASVQPLYPNPGAGALIALPRLVLGAQVSFVLSDGSVVKASGQPDGSYQAPVGSASVAKVVVQDDCGNSGVSQT